MEILQYSPGQKVTIVLETLLYQAGGADGYMADGYRADGYNTAFGTPDGYSLVDGYYSLPIVQRIFMSNLGLASGYPQKFARLDVGLYYFQFTLPTGSSAVGPYIIDVKYINPNTGQIAEKVYQIVCAAPYGLYSVGTF